MGDKVYLYVTPFFPSPSNWRGAYCYDFVKGLEREFSRVEGEKGREISRGERVERGEWRVVVFVAGEGEDYEIGGIKVYRFRTKQLPSNLFPFLFRRYNERSFLGKVNEVLNLQSQPQISVCHSHTANYAIYALAAKRAFGAKALLHHHDPQSFGLGLGVLKHSFLYNTWLFLRFRRLFEQIDCHVFISEMVKHSFLSAPDASWTMYENYRKQMRGPAFWRCRPVRVKHSVVLHNGVDTAIFNCSEMNGAGGEFDRRSLRDTQDFAKRTLPSPPRIRGTAKLLFASSLIRGNVEVFSRREGEFVIGCIGNFIDWKDQETLIRAVDLVKVRGEGEESKRVKIKVVFVGSGPTLAACQRLAETISQSTNSSTRSPRSTRLNPQPPALTFSFLPEVRHEELPDFYRSLDLFVLPSYFEGFGCVFTEAYACGVPFITCAGQGVGDLLGVETERKIWLCRPRNPKDLAKKIAHYIEHRPTQYLAGPISFDELIPQFLQYLRREFGIII